MKVMGLDLATRSGWAVRNSDKHRSSIQCGTFTVKDREADDRSFCKRLVATIQEKETGE